VMVKLWVVGLSNIEQTDGELLTSIRVIRTKGVPTMFPGMKDQQWQSIAEQASKEMDGAKLSLLVEQLCSALDERSNGQAASVNVGAVAH
jgi:hypothetical protein